MRRILFALVLIGLCIAPVMGVAEIILMGGGVGPLTYNDTWNSTDSGTTWTLVNASSGWTERDTHSSVVMPNGSIVLMGGWNIGGYMNDVWLSPDHGITWTQQTASAGWTARQGHSSVAMPDGSIVLMGGQGGAGIYYNDTWRSTNNGVTWTQMTASAGWTARSRHNSIVIPDSNRIILMGGGGVVPNSRMNDVWESSDYGVSWVQLNASAGWSKREGQTAVGLADGSIVLMGGSSALGTLLNDVWRSTDSGVSWTLQNVSADWSDRNYHSSVAMPDGSIILTGGQIVPAINDTWRSTDNGVSWLLRNASSGWTERYLHSTVVILVPPPSLPNTIYGLVIDDNTGNLINGATVNIRNATWSATNISNNYGGVPGVYWFEGLAPNENYLLNTTKIGYTRHADVIVNTGPL